MREVAKPNDRVLAYMLHRAWLRAGRRALLKARVNRGLGGGVREQQMLDDLLDAPSFPAASGTQLCLGGVESAEAISYRTLESLQILVHRQNYVTPCTAGVPSRCEAYSNSPSAFTTAFFLSPLGSSDR